MRDLFITKCNISATITPPPTKCVLVRGRALVMIYDLVEGEDDEYEVGEQSEVHQVEHGKGQHKS